MKTQYVPGTTAYYLDMIQAAAESPFMVLAIVPLAALAAAIFASISTR